MKFSFLVTLLAFIGHVQLASAGEINGAACSENINCNSNYCVPSSQKCGWSFDTVGYAPGMECTQGDQCKSGICKFPPSGGLGQCDKYAGGGGPCMYGNECKSGFCENSTNSCSNPGSNLLNPGTPCQTNDQCASNSCMDCASGSCEPGSRVCSRFALNQGCMVSYECQSNYCNSTTQVCEQPAGGGNNNVRPGNTCESDTQCASGKCVSGVCNKFDFNQGACFSDNECHSNFCNYSQICTIPNYPTNNGTSNGTQCNPPLGANLISQLHNVLKCSKDSDCEGLMYPAVTGVEMMEAWCWMGDNGGTCGPSPAKPPACIGQCAQACDGGSPAGQEIKDMCPCLTQCSISNCHSDADKKVITHLHRDLCGLADPYFFGGYDISCPKGMYVKGKGQAGKEFCAKCPAGTYSLLRSHKNKMCKRCPKGYIQPDEGMSKCYKCEEGKKSDKARIHCV